MGIRASSGGHLGGGSSGGGGGGLTVEEVQDVVSEMTQATTDVTGVKLTPIYNDVTGKLTLALATDGAPIETVVPASVDIAQGGTLVGAATQFNFTGSGLQSISLVDDVATITVQGGGAGGAIDIGQDGGSQSTVTSLNIVGGTVTIDGDAATISIDGGAFGVGSVNGQTGTVILSTDEVDEGTVNQYYTNTRFDTRFNSKTTDNLTEGSGNLYFTNARFDARLSSKTADDLAEGSVNQYFTNTRFDARFNTKTTTNLAEGTNLYFTNTRARNAISVTDAGGDGSLSYNSATGVLTYTGPSAAEVRAHFSAGTGIAISNGQISTSAIPNSSLANSSITVAGKTVALGSSTGIALNDLSDVDTSGVNSGEALIWNGTQWITGAPTAAGTVSSVNGLSGIVVLDTDDVNEGSTNLYYTDGRVDTRIGSTNLSALADVSSTAPTNGQVLKWNGTEWAPASDQAGAGISSATVQADYDASGNLTGVSVLSGSVTASVTNAAACEVTFEFTGATSPPLSTTVYGYQRTTNTYVQRAVDANFTKRVIAGGGSSGSPTAFTSFASGTNTMVISLTRALTGASAGPGQTTHCVAQFVLV
jgi:hypothetical protein